MISVGIGRVIRPFPVCKQYIVRSHARVVLMTVEIVFDILTDTGQGLGWIVLVGVLVVISHHQVGEIVAVVEESRRQRAARDGSFRGRRKVTRIRII